MRFSNPATVTAAVMARASTEDAGAGVRALLGVETGVLIREALELGTDALPARPILVIAPGPVPTNGGVDQHTGAFYLYDDLSQGTARLDALAYALLTAYDVDRGAPTLSAGRIFLGAISEPREDTALRLRYRRFDYTVHH